MPDIHFSVPNLTCGSVSGGQQRLQIQWSCKHRQLAVGTPRPLLPRTIPIQLNPVPIRITQIQRLAHSMVRCAVERDARPHQPLQSIGQRSLGRIQNRQMIKPRSSRCRSRPTCALPRIQPNMVVISARRDKRGRVAKPLHQLKPKHTAVELQRPFQIGHLQMDMPDPYSRINSGFTHIF